MKKDYIGKKVREYRVYNNLTQEGLGEKAGLHYSYIGQVERGEKKPSLTSLDKIAKALGIGVNRLLIEYDLTAEKSIKISNITDLLIERNEEELDLIYKFLDDLSIILDQQKIEK